MNIKYWKILTIFFIIFSACMVYYSYNKDKTATEDYDSLMNITKTLSNISRKCSDDYGNELNGNIKLYNRLNSCEVDSSIKENEILDMRTELNRCEDSKPEFLRIANDVVNYRNYSYPEWACYDMSMMLIGKLNNIGYDAEIRTGYFCSSDSNCLKHSWVMLRNVPIEAIKGVVISPDEYTNYYRE